MLRIYCDSDIKNLLTKKFQQFSGQDAVPFLDIYVTAHCSVSVLFVSNNDSVTLKNKSYASTFNMINISVKNSVNPVCQWSFLCLDTPPRRQVRGPSQA